MQAAAELLKTTALRDLKASAVSRRARVATGTFYIYFENVEAVALALAWHLGESTGHLLSLLSEEWSADDTTPVDRFVRAYFDFWDEFGPILMVRNLAAAAGDREFLRARIHVDAPLYRALEAKIVHAVQSGQLARDSDPAALSGLLLGGMDHQAAFSCSIDLADFGTSREQLIRAAVLLLCTTVFGKAPASKM